MSARWRGSSPVSGSSSMTTSGSCTSPWATLTRWRMPFEYVGSLRVSDGSSSTSSRRRSRGGVGIGEAVEHGGEPHETVRGERLEDALLLGHEPDRAGDRDVGARVAPEHAHRAPRRLREPAEHAQHGRLPGTVRPEEGGHPGPDLEADVGDGDERPEPLRDALGDDGRPGRSPVVLRAPVAEPADQAPGEDPAGGAGGDEPGRELLDRHSLVVELVEDPVARARR